MRKEIEKILTEETINTDTVDVTDQICSLLDEELKKQLTTQN